MANVGVTGHRILAEKETIQTAIAEALVRMEENFPKEHLRLLTQLAEGSDRLVAECFRDRANFRITVVLPLAIDDYLEDFSPESRKEFFELLREGDEIVNMPPVINRDAAYEAAGLYILDHSDAMICVWDGKSAQGRGGTGAIVEAARRKSLPIAWIHAGNRVPETLEPTSLGAEQGRITYENF